MQERPFPSGEEESASKWTRRTVVWVLVAFAVLTVLTFPFTYFFDVYLTPFGFMYSYFWALPQAVILYFVAVRLGVPWTSTVLMGAQGILGAPVDYYLDWVVQQNLIGPLYAFLYIPLFFAVGLVADVSLVRLRPARQPMRASMISALAFTAATLGMWTLATVFFYPWGGSFEGSWLQYGYFLIPYALISGSIGGYVGYGFAKDFRPRGRWEKLQQG